jgi:hypothetical protein
MGQIEVSIDCSTAEVVARKIFQLWGKENPKRLLLKVMISVKSCFGILRVISKRPILSFEYIQSKMAFVGGNLLVGIFTSLI